MNHEHEQSGAETVLRSLAGARPPAEVERRIAEGALARKDRGFAWPRLIAGAALAGAAAAAVAVVAAGIEERASVDPEPMLAKVEAPAAGAVRSAGAEASLFAVGAHRIELQPEATVRFEATDPGAAKLRVERGAAHFVVDKLAPGESFAVRTEQVLVEVVGTEFDVAAEGACSRVTVREGRVRVTDPAGIRHLSAGASERFCARPEERAGAGEALIREALVLVSRGDDLPKAAALFERYRSENPEGAFAEEALFHLAVVKARLGDRPGAERLVREFEGRYAQSPRAARLRKWMERE